MSPLKGYTDEEVKGLTPNDFSTMGDEDLHSILQRNQHYLLTDPQIEAANERMREREFGFHYKAEVDGKGHRTVTPYGGRYGD